MPLIRKSPAPAAGDRLPVGGLASADADARWTAARRLGDDPDSVEALGRALAQESEPRVREAILTSLTRIGGPRAAAVITPHLRSDDAALRTAALDALRALPEAASEHLAELLADPDSDVRVLACELGRVVPQAAADRLLSRLLEREAHPNVCAAAVEVLAEVGSAQALPALDACAQRFAGEPFLAFSIRTARARISEKNGAPRG